MMPNKILFVFGNYIENNPLRETLIIDELLKKNISIELGFTQGKKFKLNLPEKIIDKITKLYANSELNFVKFITNFELFSYIIKNNFKNLILCQRTQFNWKYIILLRVFGVKVINFDTYGGFDTYLNYSNFYLTKSKFSMKNAYFLFPLRAFFTRQKNFYFTGPINLLGIEKKNKLKKYRVGIFMKNLINYRRKSKLWLKSNKKSESNYNLHENLLKKVFNVLNSNNISYVYIQAPNAFREDFELEISLIKKLGFCDKIGKISKEHMSQINFEYGIGFNTHASVDCNFFGIPFIFFTEGNDLYFHKKWTKDFYIDKIGPSEDIFNNAIKNKFLTSWMGINCAIDDLPKAIEYLDSKEKEYIISESKKYSDFYFGNLKTVNKISSKLIELIND